MTERRMVLHLVGSPTDDFFADLSRLYAGGCLEALADVPGYDHVVVWVGPDGRWRFPADLGREAIEAAEPVELAEAVGLVRGIAPDVALPQLFCIAGMTTYRALLDVLGVPFVGNPADVMALAAHKERTRAVVAAAGVDVPPGRVLRGHPDVDERLLDDVVEVVGLPVVVKPVDADNSTGVALVRDRARLRSAVVEAARETSVGDVLLERFVPLGREVRCAVLETDDGLRALPLEEYAVDPQHKPIRDRADKLAGSGDDLALVAKTHERAWMVADDDQVVPAVHEAARTAFRALGCRDYGLFDFRVDPEGRPWFLEAGLYCSFAPSSVVVMMAAAGGTPLPELFVSAVERTLARA